MIKRVISVDEGKENKIGTVTGAPLVETEIEGIVIVGYTKPGDEDGLTTWIVVGRIFLK